jgi:hypothetical protein
VEIFFFTPHNIFLLVGTSKAIVSKVELAG